MQTGTRPQLTWRETTPVSLAFDDPYFATGQGLDETRHVFLSGNDLPARLTPGFHIAELGVGTGLNLLAAWDLARQQGTSIRYTGFEAFPMSRDDLSRALSAFPDLAPLAETLIAAWDPAGFILHAHDLEARVIIGDARAALPPWEGQADAWFLDGFAPARNPELWEPDLMAQVFTHTAPGGSFATYSAAGVVRRALADAGFTVERAQGFGRKRHMTRGHRP